MSGIEEDREAVRNRLHIGERLLCHAQDCETEPGGQPRLVRDGVLLECLRGYPNESGKRITRTAHGCILELYSDYFAEQLRTRGADQNSGNTPVLQVDVSAEVLDLMLEYFYTNQAVTIPACHAIQLFAAAKKFHVSALVGDMIKYFTDNISACVKEPNFLDGLTDLAEDMRSLEDLFSEMKFEENLAQKLVRLVIEWGSKSAENKVVAFTLIEKINAKSVKGERSDENNPNQKPSAPPEQMDACKKPPSEVSALMGKQPEERSRNCLAYAIVQRASGIRKLHQIVYRSLQIVKCGSVLSGLPIKDDHVVLRRGEFFILEFGTIGIYEFSTGKSLYKISPRSEDQLKGITTFEEDVYAWTDKEVFLVTPRTRTRPENLKKVGESPQGISYCLRVLKRDEHGLVEFAHPNTAWTLVYRITCCNGKFVSSDKLFQMPRGIYVRPFGRFEGTDYVLLFNAFYRELSLVEVREGAEHQRIPISRFCDWFSCRHIQCGSRGYITFKTIGSHVAGAGVCGLTSVDLLTKKTTTIAIEEVVGLEKIIPMPAI